MMKDLGGYGDPDFQIQIPPAQFGNHYVFFTDPTYPETNLVIVRARGADKAFHDVKLDCAGVLGGWQAVGEYEWTRRDLQTGDFQDVDGCGNGRHAMSSDAPFGVSIWGWGTPKTTVVTKNVSCSYPAGMHLHSINSAVVTPTPN